MSKRFASRTLPKLFILMLALSVMLAAGACVAPASEVADEADVSAEEAAALAEAEGEGEDAAEEMAQSADEVADETEKAVEEAGDDAEKALDDAADALESAMRNVGELDADSSEAEVDEAFTEFNAVSEELVALAAAEGADADGLEQALDELEQQMRDAMESGEPLEFQQEFLSEWFGTMP